MLMISLLEPTDQRCRSLSSKLFRERKKSQLEPKNAAKPIREISFEATSLFLCLDRFTLGRTNERKQSKAIRMLSRLADSFHFFSLTIRIENLDDLTRDSYAYNYRKFLSFVAKGNCESRFCFVTFFFLSSFRSNCFHLIRYRHKQKSRAEKRHAQLA